MAGRFEITTCNNGGFRFDLRAGNGQVILDSEVYPSRAACLDGIAAVKKYSEYSACFEPQQAADGRPCFVLKAGSGQLIGRSRSYSSPGARNNGIDSVMLNAPSARVTDRDA